MPTNALIQRPAARTYDSDTSHVSFTHHSYREFLNSLIFTRSSTERPLRPTQIAANGVDQRREPNRDKCSVLDVPEYENIPIDFIVKPDRAKLPP